jgi:hypothetical protein
MLHLLDVSFTILEGALAEELVLLLTHLYIPLTTDMIELKARLHLS